jgi:hypothetical protein
MEVTLGAGRSGERLLVDYRELDGLILPSGVVGSGWAAKGFPLIAAGQRTWFSGGSSSGAGGTTAAVVDTAGPGYQIITNAAGSMTKFAPAWLFSWFADPTLWPASFTRRYRVTYSAVVQTTQPTDAKPVIGLTNLGSHLAAGGAGQSGIDLCFDTGVTNTWRVRSRLTPLGALVAGNNSGVGAGVRLKVGFRYTQSAAPTVEVLVNDVVLQTFTGIAALPVPAVLPAFPAAATSGGFQAMFGSSGVVADGTLIVRLARYTVETLVP